MSTVTTDPNANGAMTQQGRVPAQRTQPQRMIVHDSSQFGNLLDTAKFEHLWRLSQTFASSDLVPEQFRGKPQNCFIGIQMALRLGVDPFMFLQNCYVVHGRPGIEAKLGIALANSSGAFTGPIQYRLEGQGKTRSCTAYATDSVTGEVLEMTVDWSMVEAEGWHLDKGKQKSKWMTIPEIMFRYRSAMFLIKAYHPEVLMGMQSKEELEDIDPVPAARAVLTQRTTTLDALADRMTAVSEEEEIAQQTEVEHEATEATGQEKALAPGELAADLSRFHERCQSVKTIGEVTEADTFLRGPNGRTLTDDESVLADAWKAEAEARIRAARGERSNKTEQKTLGE